MNNRASKQIESCCEMAKIIKYRDRANDVQLDRGIADTIGGNLSIVRKKIMTESMVNAKIPKFNISLKEAKDIENDQDSIGYFSKSINTGPNIIVCPRIAGYSFNGHFPEYYPNILIYLDEANVNNGWHSGKGIINLDSRIECNADVVELLLIDIIADNMIEQSHTYGPIIERARNAMGRMSFEHLKSDFMLSRSGIMYPFYGAFHDSRYVSFFAANRENDSEASYRQISRSLAMWDEFVINRLRDYITDCRVTSEALINVLPKRIDKRVSGIKIMTNISSNMVLFFLHSRGSKNSGVFDKIFGKGSKQGVVSVWSQGELDRLGKNFKGKLNDLVKDNKIICCRFLCNS